MMTENKTVILFIDQAVSFGGSLVVLGDLVGSINKQKFKPIVITEVPKALIDYYIDNSVIKHRINHVIDYRDREKINAIIRETKWLNGFMKRMVSKFVALIDICLNSLYIIRLALLIKRYSVDIVHINNGISNTEPILAAKLMGVRVLVHFHGFGKISGLSRKVLPWVSKYVAISNFVQEAVVKEGVPGNKIEVIHNPVQFHPVNQKEVDKLKREYEIGDNELVFGILGRVIPWKGQLEFVKAAFHVLKQCPNAKACIVGDKSDGSIHYYNDIKNLVKNEGMQDRFIFTGFIQEIHPVYEMLDVLVHASIEPEPFGLVITEALSHGVPVVCSDLGATREIIRDGIDGYIVNPLDEIMLAKKIIDILKNDSKRRSMGMAGKERMQREFNIDKFSSQFSIVYDRIMLESGT